MIIMGDPAWNGMIGFILCTSMLNGSHASEGLGGNECLLIAKRDGAKVIIDYALVVHDTVVLGHHVCVDNGGQQVMHDNGL